MKENSINYGTSCKLAPARGIGMIKSGLFFFLLICSMHTHAQYYMGSMKSPEYLRLRKSSIYCEYEFFIPNLPMAIPFNVQISKLFTNSVIFGTVPFYEHHRKRTRRVSTERVKTSFALTSSYPYNYYLQNTIKEINWIQGYNHQSPWQYYRFEMQTRTRKGGIGFPYSFPGFPNQGKYKLAYLAVIGADSFDNTFLIALPKGAVSEDSMLIFKRSEGDAYLSKWMAQPLMIISLSPNLIGFNDYFLRYYYNKMSPFFVEDSATTFIEYLNVMVYPYLKPETSLTFVGKEKNTYVYSVFSPLFAEDVLVYFSPQKSWQMRLKV